MNSSTYQHVVCVEKTPDFARATRVESIPIGQTTLSPNAVLVRTAWVGINASDVNFVAGRYDPQMKPPFTAGFEALGTVERVGEQVKHVKPGATVAVMSYGAFSELLTVPAAAVIPIPKLDPAYLGMFVTGLTAYLALHSAARLNGKDTVLVTAAAGATGQIAVQLAKMAGCHVVGTCGSQEKCEHLRQLGVDRPVNYKAESLGEVLRKEYPKGVDVVFEGVGGDMLKEIVPNLAIKGRLLIIGAVSSYTNEGSIGTDKIPTLALLSKSASAVGFFLNHYMKELPQAWAALCRAYQQGKLQVAIDSTQFIGFEQVKDAVNHLSSGKNIGKVVVDVRGNNVQNASSKL